MFAVLNMQLVYFASLLAKRPLLIRMFVKKKTKQEKVEKRKQTDQQEVNALTSLTRMACSEVSSNDLSAMTDRRVSL